MEGLIVYIRKIAVAAGFAAGAALALAPLASADPILTPEISFDTTLYNDVLGPTGSEETLYNSLVSSLGATEANYLLDTNTAEPVFSGVFNGAESRFFEGAFLDTLSGEDSINQLLGISSADSQAALLAEFVATGGPPIPGSADVTLTDLTTAVGTSAFDTDLTSIANADYAAGVADLQGYLADLVSGASALGGGLDLSGLLGDLTGGLDLGSILGGLGL